MRSMSDCSSQSGAWLLRDRSLRQPGVDNIRRRVAGALMMPSQRPDTSHDRELRSCKG